MGLLDKLFSKEAQKKMNELVKDATKKINDTIDELKSGIEEGKKETSADAIKESLNGQAQELQETADAAGEALEVGFKEPQAVVLNHKRKEQFSLREDAVPSEIEDRGSNAYFRELIEKNLPGVSVQEEVPLAEITSEVPAKNRNISLLLTSAGGKKLAVMLVAKNQYRLAAVVNTMNICEDQGIPAIRFMQEFENAPAYVVGRIAAYL